MLRSARSAACSVLLWCHSTHSRQWLDTQHTYSKRRRKHEGNFGETAEKSQVFYFFYFFLLTENFSFTYGVPKGFCMQRRTNLNLQVHRYNFFNIFRQFSLCSKRAGCGRIATAPPMLHIVVANHMGCMLAMHTYSNSKIEFDPVLNSDLNFEQCFTLVF